MISVSRRGWSIAACTACVAGIAAAGWFGGVSPRFAEAAALSEQTASVRSSSVAQQAQLHKLQDMAAHTEEAAARAQALFASMPQQANLPDVFDAISAAAERAGIGAGGVQSIAPGVPVPLTAEAAAEAAKALGVNIASLDLSIVVVGTRKELLAFVSELDSLDRAFLVTGTVLTSSPTGDEQESLSVTGTMFVLQSSLPDLVAQVRKVVAATERG